MITQEELKRLFHYAPETGVFTRLVALGRKYKAGTVAGSQRKGTRYAYTMISIRDKKYNAHQFAWLYMTGVWPTHEIDHRNHIGVDNRWENLRAATHQENAHNMQLRVDNTSGFIGVHQRKVNGSFLAYTRTAEGKRIYLGHHPTAEQAARVRDEAAKRLYGEFAVLNFQ